MRVTRGTFVYRNGELVPKHEAEPVFARGPRGLVPCPSYISDKLWDIQGQHDGKYYDSKSSLRRSYRENGYVELGNDAPVDTGSRAPDASGDIVQAYKMVRDGYKPPPLETGIVPDAS